LNPSAASHAYRSLRVITLTAIILASCVFGWLIAAPARGATWSAFEVTPTHLYGISCAGESLCVAAGGNGKILTSSAPTAGKAAWTQTEVEPIPPLPPGTSSSEHDIRSVACATSTMCVAADNNGNILSSAAPTGGPGAWHVVNVNGPYRLTASACPTQSLCLVGDESGDIFVSTAPLGGSTAWSKIHVDGAGASEITAISCPTDSLCVATDSGGNVLTSNAPTAGAGSWAIAHLETPSTLMGLNARSLLSAACPSATLCLLTDRMGSVIWSTNPTGGPWNFTQVAGGDLPSVACANTSLCVALEYYGFWGTVTPTGPPASWSMSRVATVTLSQGLVGPGGGIACPAASLCVAAANNSIFWSTDPGTPGTALPRKPVEAESLATWLKRQLAKLRLRSSLGALKRKRRVVFPFSAREPGTLVQKWYVLPRRSHHGAGHVLIASAAQRFNQPETRRLAVDFTSRGLRQLRHVKAARIAVHMTFTPTGSAAASASKVLIVRR
jgi:hypothetical protein